jgi:cation transport ATPase
MAGGQRHRALAAVDALAELQPAEAGVRRPGPVGSPEAGYVEEMTPLDRVGVGDVVVILPGKRVVGDGGG